MTGSESERQGARTVVGTFVLHLRPVRVPAASIRFTHTFGLGGMALVLLTLLAATGSLLLLAYVPVVNLVAPAYAGLAFVHYLLERLRHDRQVRGVTLLDAEPRNPPQTTQ